MRQITLFILSFLIWILLVWPVDPVTGRIMFQDVAAGLIFAGVVALVMREVGVQKFRRWVSPVRYFWLLVYLAVLLYYIIKANLDVVYRVMHPALPIRPGIVKVNTVLKTETAITALANSITLTPGTLSVDVAEGGILYVHWINVQTTDIEEASALITRRFENLLKKVFE